MALEESELSPRELATKFTDEKQYFVCEATVYRLLKAQDLIASPAYIVIKARDEFHTKTTRPNEMWQTDFTYFKLIGWGWVYLSTVLDDYSRYIISWKLCTTMTAGDVTDTLDLALGRLRLRQRHRAAQAAPAVGQWPELCRGRTGRLYRGPVHEPCARRALSPPDPGQDRALAPDLEEPHPAGELLPARRSRSPDRSLHRALQPPALSRKPGQCDARRRLLGRDRQIHAQRAAIKKQTIEHRRLQHRKLAA
jgi:putative transposase